MSNSFTVKNTIDNSSYMNWDGSTDKTIKKSLLCAKDKTLTLEKIRKEIEKRRTFLNRSLRDHVEYSY